MIAAFVNALLALGVGIAALSGLLYVQQPAMVFFPMRELVATPADWGLAYEDVRFAAADGIELHGWYVPAPGARRVLLFFHGNGGNISHRRESIEIFHRLGLNVLIIDYRGYGRSSGTPSEAGLYLDGEAAWVYLTRVRGFAASDIVVFGRSLGGAVAATTAAAHPPRALILESTLSSAQDFAREAFPVLSTLMVMRYEFPTAARMSEVRCPVLVLHSPEDEIMPFALGEKVFAAAREPRTFVRLRGDHNGGFVRSQPAYERALRDFLGS